MLVLDTSGGRHGVLSLAAWEPGPIEDSMAVAFSGNGTLIAEGLPLDPPVAFALWLLKETDTPQPIILLEDSERFAPHFGVGCEVDQDNRPQFITADGGSGLIRWVGASTLPVGRWFHLVCQAHEDGSVTFAVDGRLEPGELRDAQGTSTMGHTVGHAPWSTTSIGYAIDGFQVATRSLEGSLDDVRVYRRTLSEAEAQRLASDIAAQ